MAATGTTESGPFAATRDSAGTWIVSVLEAERDRWLLWLPVGFGSGIAVYFLLPAEPPSWLGPVLLAPPCALAILARRHRALLLVLCALAVILAGFATAQLRIALVAAPVLAKKLGPATIAGQVIDAEPRQGGGRIVVQHLQVPGLAEQHLPQRVRIKLTARDPAMPRPGQWVQLRAVLNPPPGPAAPGAFDFARQAYFKRLGGVGYAVGHLEPMMPPPAAASTANAGLGEAWELWWSDLRLEVARRVLAVLPGERGAIAAALMTGERGAIPPAVVEAMRDSGLAHLLAISGLHMGLVAGLLFFGIRMLLAAFPPLALNYPIKKWAAVAAALGAFVYLFLVGATIPSQRAFLMVSAVLLAVLLDRSAITLRLVAWAAFAVLLMAPESLLSAGFQMSFAAVTALIAGYEVVTLRWIGQGQERTAVRRLSLYLAGIALTSLIATAATAPFAIYHFNRFAWYGLAANMVAVPVTGFWIMPWALIAFILMPLGLESLALQPMGWGVGAVIAVAQAIADLPGAVEPVRAMPLLGLFLVVFGGLWLCLWQRPWRLAGLGLVAAGFLTIPLTQPPDILVSGDGKLLAVRDDQGRLWLSSLKAQRFTAKSWLRRAGLREGLAWPDGATAADGPLACDSLGCIVTTGGHTVALARKVAALEEDCAAADIVISLEPVPRRSCGTPAVVLDRFDLWRYGAHALWISGSDLRIESVAASRGRRPWVQARP